MKVVAFLPVKGTSERLKNKNMLTLFDMPLFIIGLKKLLNCTNIDEVYLDTESEEMIRVASSLKGLKILKRDPAFATNKTTGNVLLLNAAARVDADIYVELFATSPFLKKETIEKAVEILKNNAAYDSVTTVRRCKYYLMKDGKPSNYDLNNFPNSFNLDETTIETTGLYAIRKHTLFTKKTRLGDAVYALDVSATEAIDIDYPEDYGLARYVALGMGKMP